MGWGDSANHPSDAMYPLFGMPRLAFTLEQSQFHISYRNENVKNKAKLKILDIFIFVFSCLIISFLPSLGVIAFKFSGAHDERGTVASPV